MGFKIKANINNEEVQQKLKMVLFRVVLKLQELAVQHCPVDTGRLVNSINIRPATFGATKYKVKDGTEYGIFVEYGTKPHQVGPMNLKDWAKRKLKNEKAAFAIAKKIAQKGTDAHPFMYPAYLEVREFWVEQFFKEEFR